MQSKSIVNRKDIEMSKWTQEAMEKRLGDGHDIKVGEDIVPFRPIAAGEILGSTHYLTGLTGPDIPIGIAEFFKQTLSSGAFSKKGKVDIYETPFENLHVITATAELADLQPKLEAKHKINKLAKLLEGQTATAEEQLSALASADFEFDITEEGTSSQQEAQDMSTEVEDAPVVRFLQKMLVDAINHKRPAGATENTVLGPFFVHGAPEIKNGDDMSVGTASTPAAIRYHANGANPARLT